MNARESTAILGQNADPPSGTKTKRGEYGGLPGPGNHGTLVQMQDFQVGTGLDRKRFGGILRATL